MKAGLIRLLEAAERKRRAEMISRCLLFVSITPMKECKYDRSDLKVNEIPPYIVCARDLPPVSPTYYIQHLNSGALHGK